MDIPFDIKDKYWDNIHPGMMTRFKHRIILIRHGESESNIELTTTGKTSEFAIDHQLTDIGREQAQDIEIFFDSKGLEYIDRIEISPLDRAIQTAMPCLLNNSIKNNKNNIDIELNYELREKYNKTPYWCKFPNYLYEILPFIKEINFNDNIYDNKEHGREWIRQRDSQFENRIEKLVNSWKTIGTIENRKQSLIFTHSQVISQILSSDKSFHLANGSISIIDIDVFNKLHVQVANYTKHLQNPTGMHTCIF